MPALTLDRLEKRYPGQTAASSVSLSVRDGEFISLAFFVRFDREFDTDDVIVIALQKSFGGSSQADASDSAIIGSVK